MARIMLAMHDDEMRSYLAQRLKKCGHAVTRVSNFEAALTILDEAAFEMLLTSIDATKPSEIDFARTAQEIDPEMRIMFITGFSAIAVKRPEERRDAESMLDGKPVHLMTLANEVDRLVAA